MSLTTKALLEILTVERKEELFRELIKDIHSSKVYDIVKDNFIRKLIKLGAIYDPEFGDYKYKATSIELAKEFILLTIPIEDESGHHSLEYFLYQNSDDIIDNLDNLDKLLEFKTGLC